MSKFIEAVRKLFSRKNEGTKAKEESTASAPNDVQKPVKVERPYDDVAMDGKVPQVDKQEGTSNDKQEGTSNVQVAPQRAPRQYEEVDVPGAGGAVQVK